MKIAVSSIGDDLKSKIDPRFGRCTYFLIINPEDMSFEVFDNQSANQSSGAGIQAAQFIADKGVMAVITGHVGPNASKTLSAAGIKVYSDQQGTIEDVLQNFKNGHLSPEKTANVDGPTNRGIGVGSQGGGRIRPGQGGGRGMGQGGGRGMGQGGGRGAGQGGGRGLGRSGGSRR